MGQQTDTVNGNRFGWASTAISILGDDTPDMQDISYKPKVDIGKARGKGSRTHGRTRGESDADGSFTLLKSTASKLIKKLGPGFMSGKKDFAISVSYSEIGEDEIITDELFGVRIVGCEDNPKQGTEPLTTKFDFHIMRIKLNGIDPFGD